MKATGIIVEYNPFHNGHLYHLQQTKKETEADMIIAVMSGNFLQRGEPALVSKWARTKMALEGGADIVVELPYVFATQKAETFAFGAVSILDALLVDRLCFGSEHGKIEAFTETLAYLQNHKQPFDQNIRDALKQGVSYPKATSMAFEALKGHEDYLDLTQPNNILGYHYVKAIDQLNSTIQPYTILRTGAHYHDETFGENTGNIASATSIRKSLLIQGETLDEIKNYIPGTTLLHLKNYDKEYRMFHQWESYFDLLKYKLLTTKKEKLKTIYEMEEGLENRLQAEIKYAETFLDFMKKIKTKRYTWTRLQRACTHILTNSTKEEMLGAIERPHYIRLLGMSTKGQQYLNHYKKRLKLPVISKLSAFKHSQLDLDIKATYAYSCALKEPLKSQFIRNEFATPPIRYHEKQKKFC